MLHFFQHLVSVFIAFIGHACASLPSSLKFLESLHILFPLLDLQKLDQVVALPVKAALLNTPDHLIKIALQVAFNSA